MTAVTCSPLPIALLADVEATPTRSPGIGKRRKKKRPTKQDESETFGTDPIPTASQEDTHPESSTEAPSDAQPTTASSPEPSTSQAQRADDWTPSAKEIKEMQDKGQIMTDEELEEYAIDTLNAKSQRDWQEAFAKGLKDRKVVWEGRKVSTTSV